MTKETFNTERLPEREPAGLRKRSFFWWLFSLGSAIFRFLALVLASLGLTALLNAPVREALWALVRGQAGIFR